MERTGVIAPDPLARKTSYVFTEDLGIGLQREGQHPVDRKNANQRPEDQKEIDDDPALAGLRGSRCVFFNGDDYLAYMVMYSDIPDSNFSQIKPIEGIDSKYKTIADKEGVLTVENGVYTFIYPTDNGYVQIISNKEDLIGQAII